jgi:hypothetical protein
LIKNLIWAAFLVGSAASPVRAAPSDLDDAQSKGKKALAALTTGERDAVCFFALSQSVTTLDTYKGEKDAVFISLRAKLHDGETFYAGRMTAQYTGDALSAAKTKAMAKVTSLRGDEDGSLTFACHTMFIETIATVP